VGEEPHLENTIFEILGGKKEKPKKSLPFFISFFDFV
jgi:hypothetical protein